MDNVSRNSEECGWKLISGNQVLEAATKDLFSNIGCKCKTTHAVPRLALAKSMESTVLQYVSIVTAISVNMLSNQLFLKAHMMRIPEKV